MRRRPSVVLIAPGAETSWADDGGRVTQATVVAVDDVGSIQAFGSEAALSAARRRSSLQLIQPFSAAAIDHPSLTRSYLHWLLDSSGHRSRNTVLAILVPSTPAGIAESWKFVCDGLGFGSVMVSRPVAAATGLGMEVDSGAAHMIVDVTSDTAEVAVVGEGAVLFSRSCEPDPHQVASVIRSALVQIDPDLEWDVLGGGIHVLGHVPVEDWKEELSTLVGVPVSVASDAESILFAGARATLDDIEPYLSSVTPGVGRFFRGVLAGFGH